MVLLESWQSRVAESTFGYIGGLSLAYCCREPAGAMALRLALLGLEPMAAALVWLAMGTSGAWWDLSSACWACHGSFMTPLLTILTAYLALTKSVVNSCLCDPHSLLGDSDPTELPLLGSFLGKPGPPMGSMERIVIIEQSWESPKVTKDGGHCCKINWFKGQIQKIQS